MNIQTQIEAIAVSHFATAMKSCPPDSNCDDRGVFSMRMSLDVDGEKKPLLIFGVTYRFYGDGRCFAVLNPSRKVLDCVKSTAFYEKSAFIGECDMVNCLQINTNGKSPRVTGGYSYRAKKPLPARSQIV